MKTSYVRVSSTSRYSVREIDALGDFTISSAVDINDNGQVAVILSCAPKDLPSRSYLWEEGRMIDLGAMKVKALNNSLQVVGTYHRDNDSYHAAIWRNGKTERLFNRRKVNSEAEGINEVSQVVGQWTDDARDKLTRNLSYTRQGYVWSSGTAHPLATIPQYSFGSATAINNQGDIVGYLQAAPAPGKLVPKEQAVLWEGDNVTLLGNLSGFDESRAIAINNKRQILCKALTIKWRIT